MSSSRLEMGPAGSPCRYSPGKSWPIKCSRALHTWDAWPWNTVDTTQTHGEGRQQARNIGHFTQFIQACIDMNLITGGQGEPQPTGAQCLQQHRISVLRAHQFCAGLTDGLNADAQYLLLEGGGRLYQPFQTFEMVLFELHQVGPRACDEFDGSDTHFGGQGGWVPSTPPINHLRSSASVREPFEPLFEAGLVRHRPFLRCLRQGTPLLDQWFEGEGARQRILGQGVAPVVGAIQLFGYSRCTVGQLLLEAFNNAWELTVVPANGCRSAF